MEEKSMHAAEPTVQLSTRVLRSPSEIEGLTTTWEQFSTARDADLDFYLFIIQLYSEAVRPHVIAIYQNNTPRALLLGRLEEKQITFGLGYIKFKFNKIRVLTFIHAGLLGNLTEHEAQCILESISSSFSANEAQAACFESINIEEPLFRIAFLKRHPLTERLLIKKLHYSRRFEPGKAFLESVSSNVRSNHKRRTRKMLDTYNGQVNLVCVRDPDKINMLMRDAEIVAGKSYQRGLQVGYHASEQTRERLLFQAERGWLRGYILYIEGKPSAFWIGSLYRGTFFSDYLAFDPAYEKVAPGAYLTFEALKMLASEGLATNVDFGGGEAEYKARLSNKSWVEAQIWLFASSFHGQTLRLIWTTVVATNFVLRRLLRWTKIEPRLKRYLHRRTTSLDDLT